LIQNHARLKRRRAATRSTNTSVRSPTMLSRSKSRTLAASSRTAVRGGAESEAPAITACS
jgi:hypothetical protein